MDRLEVKGSHFINSPIYITVPYLDLVTTKQIEIQMILAPHMYTCMYDPVEIYSYGD